MARDHRDAYRRRNELARAQGYRSYAEARKRREAGSPLPTDRTVRPDLKQITKLGEGSRRLVRGRRANDPIVMGQLNRASGQIRFTVTTADGVTHNILSKGGWNAQAVRDRIDAMGLDAFIADQLGKAYGMDTEGPAGEVVGYTVDVM